MSEDPVKYGDKGNWVTVEVELQYNADMIGPEFINKTNLSAMLHSEASTTRKVIRVTKVSEQQVISITPPEIKLNFTVPAKSIHGEGK